MRGNRHDPTSQEAGEDLPAESATQGGPNFPVNRSPFRLLVVTIAGIAIAETIAMVVVYFYRSLPYYQEVLLDATVMIAIISPLLYFLGTRPLFQEIQQRRRTETILQSRLRLIQFAGTHTLEEVLQFTLDEIEELTGSTIGYFHFLQPDQKTLWLRAWSTRTLRDMCTLARKDSHYDVDQAGVWTDCIRARRPVIHNDYSALPHRRGLPEGHAPLVRELTVPILREGKIVAVLGVGNKPREYSAQDVKLAATLADFAWDTIRQKQDNEALRESEEKFRTLVEWTYDWELWISPHGNVVYTSPSCERMTGYGPEEFKANPDRMVDILHPDDRAMFEDHLELIHSESAGVEKVEYRILHRDGSLRWIEHVCRPLFGADHRYLGRRVSNRDITERKQAEETIRERNQKEQLLTQTIHAMQLDIARDLHDTIGQNISFLRMKLDDLAEGRIREQTELRLEIQSMARAADESYDLMRGTLAVLQSENSTDLVRLFRRYAEQLEERSSLHMDVVSRGEARFMTAKRMRQLFYIFREILSNIEKHAQADQVRMEMCWNASHLDFSVSDNGRGFEMSQVPSGSHYGLRFMKDRVELLNGFLAVHSVPGSGTRVEIQIPYEQV